MRMEKAVLTLIAAAGVWSWDARCEAATTTHKICGRKLSDIMSRICHEYNSPTWDDPVEEQPAGVVRRRRQIGIADECCIDGCTFEQLTNYCAVSKNWREPSESSIDALDSHLIADRSTETEVAPGAVAVPPAMISKPTGEDRLNNVERAAPVVGTVSPLLTWGRTLHAELAPAEADRYAYVGLYTRP